MNSTVENNGTCVRFECFDFFIVSETYTSFLKNNTDSEISRNCHMNFHKLRKPYSFIISSNANLWQ